MIYTNLARNIISDFSFDDCWDAKETGAFSQTITTSRLEFPLKRRGKLRDIGTKSSGGAVFLQRNLLLFSSLDSCQSAEQCKVAEGLDAHTAWLMWATEGCGCRAGLFKQPTVYSNKEGRLHCYLSLRDNGFLIHAMDVLQVNPGWRSTMVLHRRGNKRVLVNIDAR